MSPVSKRASGRRSSRRSISEAERDSNTSTIWKSLIRSLLRDIVPHKHTFQLPSRHQLPDMRSYIWSIKYRSYIVPPMGDRTPELRNTSRCRYLHLPFDERAESCLVQLLSTPLQRSPSSLWR